MNKVFIGILIIVIGALAGWFAFSGKSPLPQISLPNNQQATTPAPTNEPSGLYTYTETSVTPVPQATSATTKGGQATSQPVSTKTVQYTDTGFTPPVITVPEKSAVTFVNQSGGNMWVKASGQPIPQELSGFDQGKSVARGGTYTYTFAHVGTWKYFNQAAQTHTGIVVVTK